jgi:signal transduction histidine kinase
LVEPIQHLEKTALAIAHGDLSKQATVETTDEVGALADTFNYMIGELRGLIDKQRLFIANASHELRTPLTNIKLRSEALLDLGDEEPSVRQRYISEIDSEADRLGRLANTLLDLSRIETACRAPAREAIDLAPVLLAVVKSVRLRMNQAHLTFKVQIPPQLPPLAVWSDQVEAIVLNLLDNAIKYTPSGGTIRFQATVEQADCVLRVQDNGPGIPPEDLPYVFDRFYRVDKARSRQSARLSIGSGVGLGLAIVKTLVEQNNGSVQIESMIGQGTTLVVKFPLVAPSQTTA